jgi:hypothetical protein
VRFRAVFEAAPDRREALRELVGLWLDAPDQSPAPEALIRPVGAWQDEILNDFGAGQTSGPVGGSTPRRE